LRSRSAAIFRPACRAVTTNMSASSGIPASVSQHGQIPIAAMFNTISATHATSAFLPTDTVWQIVRRRPPGRAYARPANRLIPTPLIRIRGQMGSTLARIRALVAIQVASAAQFRILVRCAPR
jgi:hypothetical protein